MNEWVGQAYEHFSMTETKKNGGFVLLILIVILCALLRVALATVFRVALRDATGATRNRMSDTVMALRKWLAGKIRNTLTKTEERRIKKNEEDDDEYY